MGGKILISSHSFSLYLYKKRFLFLKNATDEQVLRLLKCIKLIKTLNSLRRSFVIYVYLRATNTSII